MLKLKLWYFGHLMRRTDHWNRPWCWERLKAGGEGDSRGWDGWMASLTQWTWVSANSRRWWRTGKPGVLQSMGVTKSQTRLRDWTELKTQQSTAGHTHRGNRTEKDTCTPVFIAALFIISRTWKQARCPSADEWIRKLWYLYTMEYYSAIKKNTFESVQMRWMKLGPIMQSEVSQKEKHQYSILMHICGI